MKKSSTQNILLLWLFPCLCLRPVPTFWSIIFWVLHPLDGYRKSSVMSWGKEKHDNLFVMSCLPQKNRIHSAAGFMLNVLVGSYPPLEWDKEWGNKKIFSFLLFKFCRTEHICFFSEAKYMWDNSFISQSHFIILTLALANCMSFHLFLWFLSGSWVFHFASDIFTVSGIP